MSNMYLKNLFNNLKRERLLSLSNVFMMTFTFLILGIFISVIVISQTILKNLEQQAQVTIFFKDEFGENKILDVEKRLTADGRILDVTYISKERAYDIFAELNKDDPLLLESANSSILPASLDIRAKNISDLPKLAEEFGNLEGVEEVRFFEDVINNFRNFSTIAYIVGFTLVVVFLVISYSVVISTLRMTINSKGTELEIMKLVGATDSYVRIPLIYQGVFYGLISALISGVILFAAILLLGHFGIIPTSLGLGFLPNVALSHILYSALLLLTLIISGILLGFLGSVLAVKRYLKY